MKDRADLARGWFAKAESDLANARLMLLGPGPYDGACFHCQQVVEKYLKGFLIWKQQDFPLVHDVEKLALACQAVEPSLKLVRPEVVRLTEYAVTLRYDMDFWPSQTEARKALATAEDVRSAILGRVPPEVLPEKA